MVIIQLILCGILVSDDSELNIYLFSDNTIIVNTSVMIKDQSSYVDKLEVKAIRIAHTHKLPTSIYPSIAHISTKVIVPERLSRLQYETLPETLYRADCWLKHTGMLMLSVGVGVSIT